MTLPVIAASALPRLAYAHSKEHDPALTQPQKFRQVINSALHVKPDAGGLWTSPVTAEDDSRQILSTAWLDWCRLEGFGLDRYTHFLEVSPLEDFRGLRIDTLEDARALVEAFPGPLHPRYRCDPFWAVLDWERMAAQGYDAVYLTDEGQWATRLPDDKRYSLYGWDAASVLWLRPSYQVVTP